MKSCHLRVLVCALLSALLSPERTVSQEIQLQRSTYSVVENISSSNLVLRVCVEGIDLESQQYSVQLTTEQSSFGGMIPPATDGEDYIGIDESLVLTGPGSTRRCTCVEVLEDEVDEDEEVFTLRLSGSNLITRGEVPAYIRDNDGIAARFVGDTPRVDGNVVTFQLEFEPGVVSATCAVAGHGTVDCTNGSAQFVLPPNLDIAFQPEIVTTGSDGQTETSSDTNRLFRTSSTGRCSVHLINEGISYNRVTGETTFQWAWTGPGEEGFYLCQLDGRSRGICETPYTVSGVSSGSHVLRVIMRRGDCLGRAHRRFRFEVP